MTRPTLQRRKWAAGLRGRPTPGAGLRGSLREGLSCPICGTLVDLDDALGVIAGRLGHAECVLVRWLHTSAPADWEGRPNLADGRHGHDDDTITLLGALEDLCSGEHDCDEPQRVLEPRPTIGSNPRIAESPERAHRLGRARSASAWRWMGASVSARWRASRPNRAV